MPPEEYAVEIVLFKRKVWRPTVNSVVSGKHKLLISPRDVRGGGRADWSRANKRLLWCHFGSHETQEKHTPRKTVAGNEGYSFGHFHPVKTKQPPTKKGLKSFLSHLVRWSSREADLGRDVRGKTPENPCRTFEIMRENKKLIIFYCFLCNSPLTWPWMNLGSLSPRHILAGETETNKCEHTKTLKICTENVELTKVSCVLNCEL